MCEALRCNLKAAAATNAETENLIGQFKPMLAKYIFDAAKKSRNAEKQGKKRDQLRSELLKLQQCLANECWKKDIVIDREPNSLKIEKTNSMVNTKSLFQLGSEGVRNLVDESICHPRADQEKHYH